MENREPQTLTIAPAEWSASAAMWLSLAVQHATVADLRAQVDCGAASLFEVESAGRMVGAFVLRVDQCAGRHEGVIVAAAGNLRGVDFTAAILPHVESLFSGVAVIRIHTARCGMAAKLAAAGYVPRELVFSKVMQ